ncbi:MAG: hypothetical protein HYW26_03095 [Candidatus Aenigmarchaeota archaeon]|nr:hypothetical protein [Candidatus Aenigmarchaeota archaeon]
MRYDFTLDDGETVSVDTRELSYGAIWNALRLKGREREAANRVIDLYNREPPRHQADHYRTRMEIERAAQNNKLVRKLIHCRILELHFKWWRHLVTRREERGGIRIGPGHARHLQAPYRLDVWKLHTLDPDYEPEYEESEHEPAHTY